MLVRVLILWPVFFYIVTLIIRATYVPQWGNFF